MTTIDPAPEFLTCDEVARILRCQRETVQAYCRDGHLAGKKVGRNWLVTRSAVREFLNK